MSLGQDQDTLCGSFDPGQAFLGSMTEVRLWKTSRSHGDIDRYFRERLNADENGLVSLWPLNCDMRGRNAVSGQVGLFHGGLDNVFLCGPSLEETAETG